MKRSRFERKTVTPTLFLVIVLLSMGSSLAGRSLSGSVKCWHEVRCSGASWQRFFQAIVFYCLNLWVEEEWQYQAETNNLDHICCFLHTNREIPLLPRGSFYDQKKKSPSCSTYTNSSFCSTDVPVGEGKSHFALAHVIPGNLCFPRVLEN